MPLAGTGHIWVEAWRRLPQVGAGGLGPMQSIAGTDAGQMWGEGVDHTCTYTALLWQAVLPRNNVKGWSQVLVVGFTGA